MKLRFRFLFLEALELCTPEGEEKKIKGVDVKPRKLVTRKQIGQHGLLTWRSKLMKMVFFKAFGRLTL